MQWSNYQLSIFEAVEKTEDSLIVEAVAGCLSGDTIIGVNRGGKSYNCTIEHLTAMMNGARRSGKIFDPSISTCVRSYDPKTGSIRLAAVARAVCSGEKLTSLLVAGDFSIRATQDHKFLTVNGWKPLGELFVGDSILVDGGKGYLKDGEKQSKPLYKYVYRMDSHPFRSVTHNRGVAYYRVPEHRLVIEAALNDVEFEIFVEDIRAGNLQDYEFLDPKIVEVHHRDENSQHNEIDNLVVLSIEEHRKHHAKNGGWQHVQAFATSRRITHIGTHQTETTYDLTMEDSEQPNFLANGIVVHNSGKTTTIVEAINHVNPTKTVAFCAFNKSIAEELKRRITAPNARAMTLHSVGYAAWRKFLGRDSFGCKVSSTKTQSIVKSELSDDERWKYGGQMSKLIGIAKGQGVVPKKKDEHVYVEGYDSLKGLVEDDDELWEEMIDFYRLDRDECSIELSREVLLSSIALSREDVDYDDMLYMPVISNAQFEKFDVVFLDEAQDVNSIQVEIVSRMLKPDSRVIAVGDRHQAIYGFRGALSESMSFISDRFRCRSLPLSVSYRCPRNIVKKAQEFVQHIQPHEDAPEGLVFHTVAFWNMKDFRPNDAILCRVAKPLVFLAFDLIRNKISCRVLGRDIGQGLVKLVRKMKVRDIAGLEIRLQAWRTKEIIRAKGDEDKIAAIEDKLATLNVFIDELAPTDTVDTLIANIEALFSDEGTSGTRLTLATVHKSKGLEWDRVFVLDAHMYMPSKWAKSGWQRQQETNLCYVAATRARRELYYISSEAIIEKELEKCEPIVEMPQLPKEALEAEAKMIEEVQKLSGLSPSPPSEELTQTPATTTAGSAPKDSDSET